MDLILHNARIVTSDTVIEGSLAIDGQTIAAVDEAGRGWHPGAIDCEGDFVLPGLIDIHTDNLEKHVEPRPGVRWPITSAIMAHDDQLSAGGITTVLDALAIGYGERKAGRAGTIEEASHALGELRHAGALRCEHFLHLRCEVASETLLQQLAAIIDHALVRLVSVMDHTPGQRQWRDLDKWRLFLSQFRDPSIDSPAQLARRRELQDRFAVANRRTVVEACRLRHIPLASHDDTTAAHVEEAAADGIAISEFPTTLEAAALAQGKGIATVMGSPNVVNRRSHSGNVSALELARHGLVDVLASDYVPHSLMHAVFALHREVEISLPDAVATVSRTPANLLGLKDRGAIECGRRADLVRVALAPDGTPVVRSVWRAGQRVN